MLLAILAVSRVLALKVISVAFVVLIKMEHNSILTQLVVTVWKYVQSVTIKGLLVLFSNAILVQLSV